MKKFPMQLRLALTLLLAAALLSFLIFGCQRVVGPSEDGGAGDPDWYLEVEISPPVSPSLIIVEEYRVTNLIIEVTDPLGEEIQVINWAASEGGKRYRIPVSMEGPHEVTVTHISKGELETVEASESAIFNIQAMIITQVKIIPGAIGFIDILAPARWAVDIARLEILPEVLKQAEATRYALLRMEEPLPPGTMIYEDAPVGAQDRAMRYEMDEEGYLFYLDLEPGAYFAHPVRYFIVKESGKTDVLEAEWWPRVNKTVPEQFVADVPLLKYVVERNVSLVKKPITAIDWKIYPGIITLLRTEAFLSVQGLTPGESLYGDAVATHNNVYSFFDAYKSSTSKLVGITDYDADDVLNQIEVLAEEGYDIITIHIIAHGNVNLVKLGGVYMYASQFVSTMSALPDIQFNFLLTSCHAGSFMDDLDALPNVRVVGTACRSNESAYGDKDVIGTLNDYNSSDTGAEWTSSFLKAAERIVLNSGSWTIVSNTASAYKVSRTSVLLNEAGYLAVGANRGLPLTLFNYDLTNRAAWCTPMQYASWEALE
jgi:hypothetical protein